MPVSFTSHNIRLDDGSHTKPDTAGTTTHKLSFMRRNEGLPGRDLVLEQFDSLGPNVALEMTEGSYRTSGRSTFIGIKTAYAQEAPAPDVSPGLRQA